MARIKSREWTAKGEEMQGGIGALFESMAII
jgi:hypothetical protein